jgi:hypothetical protein
LEEQEFELLLFGYDYADSGDRIHFETNIFEILPDAVDNLSVKFDQRTGELNITPLNSMVGEHTIKFRVGDQNGAFSDWQEVQFTIINVPDPPVMRVEETYNAEVGKKFTTQILVHDEDKDDVLLFWDNTELFDIDPETGIISFTPSSGDEGTHRLTIFVSDGNLSVQQDINITIEKGKGMDFFTLLPALIITAFVVIAAVGTIFYKRRSPTGRKNEGETEKEPKVERDLDEEEEDEEDEG